MTVADLIRLLCQLPQDVEVCTIDHSGDESSVMAVSFYHDERYGPVGNNMMDRVLIRID